MKEFFENLPEYAIQIGVAGFILFMFAKMVGLA